MDTMFNNYNIREIMLRISNLEDFLSMAEVCDRFQKIALTCFQSNFSEVSINKDFRQERAESLLSNFGHLIRKIEFKLTGNPHRDSEILNLISTFGRHTLTSLAISTPKPMQSLESIELPEFLALEELDLDGVRPSIIILGPPLMRLTLRNMEVSHDEMAWLESLSESIVKIEITYEK
jgi:hypothetical protein